MKKTIFVFALAVSLLGATSALAAVGATLRAGSQGFGAAVTVGINEKLNARLNLNTFSYGMTIAEDDNEGGSGGTIEPVLKLFTVGALLDWHPAAQGFRLSAGLYLNKNKVDITADLNDTVEINGRDYFLSDIGGRVDFNSLAPYLGIGYGNAVGSDGHWHFSFDLGAMFQGAPQIEIHATASDPALQSPLNADIAEKEKSLEDDLAPFKIYPVIATGVSYHF